MEFLNDFSKAFSSLISITKSVLFTKYLSSLSTVSFFAVIGQVTEPGKSQISWSGWPGERVSSSRGPYFAHCKAGELLWLDQSVGLSKTPVPDFKESYGWKGGVRCNDFYVAVSALSQEHDQIFAAIILYEHLYQGIKLHHIGYSCTPQVFDEKRNTSAGYFRNTTNLSRFYIPKNNLIFGKSYFEYFHDAQNPLEKEIHLDFVVDNIDQFMDFLSDVTEVKPEYYPDASENSTQAGIFITDSKGITLGVMARSSFWNIEND